MGARELRIGPWLVGLGAALWGTENAWRIPLNELFDQPDVLVFWEHVILATLALPFVLPRLGELRRVRPATIAWLVFSGVAGSAVGAVLFTHAIKDGNPTIANLVLGSQPILSTTAACLLFGDRLARMFWPWAALAIAAGLVLGAIGPGFQLQVDSGTGYALACALAWGLSTVAGRGVMVEMSLPLAAGLRVIIRARVHDARGRGAGLRFAAPTIWPAAAHAHMASAVVWLVLLATLSGGIPLLIYFRGLSMTRASTAGYFEMMQTLAAVVITWGVFGAALTWYQVIAAVVLIIAVSRVQRAQETVEPLI